MSESAKRYIQNILNTSTAGASTKDDSSDDSDDEEWKGLGIKVGSMELVHKTLRGIAFQNKEDGAVAMGRYGKTIRLGKDSWQSPSRSDEQCRKV